MIRFDGRRDPNRRESAAYGAWAVVDSSGKRHYSAQYKKTGTIFAVRMPEDFEVETLEGTMRGRAGSWLAVGADGELWPIEDAIFAKTYTVIK